MRSKQLLTIPKLKQIDFAFLGVVIAFILDFGNIKYAMAGLFVLAYSIGGSLRQRGLVTQGIGSSFVTILKGIVILLGITAILQIMNGFHSYAINEAIYFLTPLMVVWIYVSMTEQKRLSTVIDIIFVIVTVDYIYKHLPYFTISNLKDINLADSFSVFEDGKALWFLIFECYYLTNKDKTKAMLAFVLCLFCFKRLYMLIALMLLLFQKHLHYRTPIKRKILLIIVCAYIMLAVLSCVMIDDRFAAWFEATFGIAFDKFTMSRFERLSMVLNSDQIRYGLGSVTTYMTQVLNEIHGSNIAQRSLHNDLVRIYLECGIIGLVSFVYTFLRAADFDRGAFLIMSIMLLASYVNPTLGAGSAGIWTLVYLLISHASEYRTVKK